MSLIKRIYFKWRRYKMRREAQTELSEQMFNDPEVYKRKAQEINCIISGHKWSTDFDPVKELGKLLHKRAYCKRCGVYYHTHNYNHTITDNCEYLKILL